MKRYIALVLLALLAFATPLYAASQPKMLAYMDQSNQSFIPVGVLKGYEGIKVQYSSAQKKIDIIKNENKLTFYLGTKTAYVNDKKMTIKAAPFQESGITYIPLQFVSQHLKLKIEWDKNTSSLLLSEGDVSVQLPVLSGRSISSASAKPIVSSRKTFKVGSRSFNTQIVTISLLHPKIELDVAIAGNQIGKVEDLRSIAKRNNAVAAINGTFFAAYTTGSYKGPFGYIVGKGKLLKDSPGDRRTVFTFDSNNLAQLVRGLDFKPHFQQGKSTGAVQAGPRLVVNGKVSLDLKNEGFKDPKILTGGGARSALGITKDHKLILLTTGGATIPQLAEIMKQAGSYQAMNLDGGASSGLYYNGSYLTTPGRQISNAIIVKYSK
ncbi:phosphodiester glycosidase family protein [Paenibacillus dakarensis]|uniref:phosphodiester glycosidase family protein n=1 Tax=Paenibacillus dakarensis TaxID=1527293 RepID=UPI0006D57802|nr:phosphodiester glycosidase family protein [Paenibacillus dakarensis]